MGYLKRKSACGDVVQCDVLLRINTWSLKSKSYWNSYSLIQTEFLPDIIGSMPWFDNVICSTCHDLCTQGFNTLRRHRLIGTGIPIINIRMSSDRLKFILGFPIPINGCICFINGGPGTNRCSNVSGTTTDITLVWNIYQMVSMILVVMNDNQGIWR